MCKIGDIVHLNSGSPRMTVTNIHSNGDLEVAWIAFETKEMKTFRASRFAFKIDEPNRPRSHREFDEDVMNGAPW